MFWHLRLITPDCQGQASIQRFFTNKKSAHQGERILILNAEEEGLVGTSASFSRGEDPTNTSNPITRRLAIDFLFASILSQASLVRLDANKKPDQKLIGFELPGGGRGIRTPGTLRYNGFQDRRIRPLCHSSGREISKKKQSEDEKIEEYGSFKSGESRNC